MASGDYYQILGLGKDAGADEIKRAYRKLAHEHHPDKGGDQEKFKEISEAYDVLSDPNKRATYDQFGSAAFAGGMGGSGGVRYEDIFGGGAQTGFGGFGGGGVGDIFESFFGRAFSQVQVEVPIRLSQALLGATLAFESPAGDRVELKIPTGTQDGQGFRFTGKGMPYRGGRGDLIAIVRVQYPERLNKKQREAIEQLRDVDL